MNFDKFSNEVIERLSKSNEMHDVNINMQTIYKNNGVLLHGLLFQNSCNLSPTIYLDNFFEHYEHGKEIDDIVTEIIKIYASCKSDRSIDTSFFIDFEKVKSNIIFQVINYERNKELLKDVPFIRVFDLAIVFRVFVESNEDGTATILIHNQHLAEWEQVTETLYEIARSNTPRLNPFTISTMSDVLKQIIADDDIIDIIENTSEPQMYVIRDKFYLYGAGAILYVELFGELADKLESDLCILPSSIHELIVVPVSDVSEKEMLTEMVKEVNETHISKEDFLSDNVYYYDWKRHKIIM